MERRRSFTRLWADQVFPREPPEPLTTTGLSAPAKALGRDVSVDTRLPDGGQGIRGYARTGSIARHGAGSLPFGPGASEPRDVSTSLSLTQSPTKLSSFPTVAPPSSGGLPQIGGGRLHHSPTGAGIRDRAG